MSASCGLVDYSKDNFWVLGEDNFWVLGEDNFWVLGDDNKSGAGEVATDGERGLGWFNAETRNAPLRLTRRGSLAGNQP